ncbi:MAG: 4-hydroxybenzoate 3-monooxygenase [Pseudonocardia sp.]|nr:4-hydroxybenzoate 3-monooxygenase [Pseudonocardia sp.]
MHSTLGQSRDAAVVIVGAGPAGLVLGNLLHAANIDCIIIERQSRAHLEKRARAGLLAANSVRILVDNGLAEGLNAHGRQHDTCVIRGDHGQFELKYSTLGRGEIHTVYPQQNLVADLIAEFLNRGGDLRFDTAVVAMHDIETEQPWLTCRNVDGSEYRLTGSYLAGCDGPYGVSRRFLPSTVRRYRRDHGVRWLAVLAQAPPSMAAVTYALHERGFAGHMPRDETVTRYYLQVPPSEVPREWTDQRIWAELGVRMRTDEYGPLRQGSILEKRIVDMTSEVHDPIRHGRLFVVGDAASLISPAAAKGANLAIMAAHTLATAMIDASNQGDQRALARYSSDCLSRIWRAQEFSHWLINLLHSPADNTEDAVFRRELQRARLTSLRNSQTYQDWFAENYVGI